jgi:ABC-2 type transport system permease protein
MIKNDMQEFAKIMENYPQALRNALSMNFDNVNSALGYYATMPFTYLVLIASLQAMLMGVSVIAKENNSKTSDFLFTKPISRLNILISKSLSAFSLLLMSDFVIMTVLYLTLVIFEPTNLNTYIILSKSVVIMQLIFLTLGIMLTTMLKKVKSPISLSMSVVLGIYAISSFADEKMRLLIPFQYFKSDYIIKNNGFEIKYLLMSILLIIIFILASKTLYLKKDINSL